VQAEGWLRRQLELMANGFTGHLDEVSKFCKFDGNAWTSRKGEGGFGWEEVPYWLKGFVDLGYLTGDERIQKESRRWIEAVLAGQLPNGYFGSRANLEASDSGAKILDIWPNMVMLYPLRSYYEATGDRRVLDFMTRYFRWQMTLPLDKFLPASWQKWRAGDNLDSIYWLYNRTGEAWLIDLARINHERTADWTGGIPTWHGVNPSHFNPPSAMDDDRIGQSSSDSRVPWAIWWDTYGSKEWAEYSFSSPRRVSGVDVYWADEGDARNAGGVSAGLRMALPGDGAVRVPESWSLLYREGTGWKPVHSATAFGVEKDKCNHVNFDPVTTTALRLEVQLEDGNTAGIIEWRIGDAQ
jgi:hypothetical protein